ncbi:MAG: polyhydroxyalkanoic acid system family protein [Agriterribacter sp.]
MKVNIPHQHTKEEATNRIKSLLQNLQEKFAGKISNVKENWNDNKADFSFSMGPFSTNGIILVNPSDVEINLDIPFIASMYAKQIRSLIEDNAKQVLA